MNLSAQFKSYLLSLGSSASKATVKNYVADVNKFITWFEVKYSRSFSPAEVSESTLSTFRKDSLEKYSASSVDRNISSLRKFFMFLKMEGQIAHSPFDEKPKSEELKEADPWRIKDFKNYLYVFNASHLTIKNYIIDLKQFVSWAEEVLKSETNYEVAESNISDQVDSNLINEYKNRLLNDAKLSPVSVNRKLSSLRRYFAWAEEEGIINSNVKVLNESSVKDLNEDFGFQADQDVAEINQPSINPSYSKFPPIRLAQKISRAGMLIVDGILILPLVALAHKAEYGVWTLKGKPVVEAASAGFLGGVLKSQAQPTNKIKNVGKEFYAPAKVSLKYYPLHKKAVFHLKHTRPDWYRRNQNTSFIRFAQLAILAILFSALSYAVYSNLGPNKNQTKTLAALPTAPPRILSFQGRLTDTTDNPITTPTALRMAIYDTSSASGSSLLWQEIVTVTPDSDGIFATLLGNNTTIPQSVFAQNSALWLGVTVGQTAELTPRQQIATVAFATNSETLQGLEPITNSASTSNVVLALNSSGNLSIGGSANPVFQSTGGSFTVQGTTLVLSTVAGSGGNVRIAPDGLGKIDLQKPLQNNSLTGNINTSRGAVEVDDLFSILATSSGQSAFTLNQDSTGPLISASTSGVAKFTVDNGGNLTAAGTLNGLTVSNGTITSGTWNGTAISSTYGGTGLNTSGSTGVPYISGGTWSVDANALAANHGGTGFTSYTSGDLIYASGTSTLSKLAIAGSNGQCLTSNGSTPSWGSCGTGTGTNWWTTSSDGKAVTPINSTMDFLLGGQSTTSAKFSVTGLSNSNSQTQASVSGQFVVMPNNGYSGRIGVGTATPQQLIDVAATLPSSNTWNPLVRLTQTTAHSDARAAVEFYSTNDSYSMAQLGAEPGSAYDAPRFILRVSDASHNLQERLTIDSSGQLNIGGDTTPNALLSVGSTSQFQVNTSGAIAAATGITSSGSITFSGLTSNQNSILYAGSGGAISTANSTTANLCLVSNAGGSNIPGWSSCAAGIGTNWWTTSADGKALTPINSTMDFLLGGQATTSAKFAVLNMAGTSTVPVASISANSGANATYLTGDGTLGTTNKQSLTIGNSSTYNTSGNVLINPNGTGSLRVGTAATGSNIMAVSAPNISNITIADFQNNGSSIFNVNNTNGLTLNAGGACNGSICNALNLNLTGAVNVTSETIPVKITSPSYTITGTYANQRIMQITQPTITAGSALSISTEADTLNIAGAPISAGSVTIANSVALRISAGTSIASGATNGYGLYVDAPTGASNNYAATFATGNVGIGDTTPTAALTVGASDAFQVNSSGAIAATTGYTQASGAFAFSGGGNFSVDSAAFDVNTSGAVSGVTTLNASGAVTFSNYNANNNVLYATVSTGQLAGASTNSTGLCLLSGASAPSWSTCPGGSGTNYWNLNSSTGVISPINGTVDLLLGFGSNSPATSSAKFAVTGMAGSGPATASVAGNMIIQPQNGAGGRLGIRTNSPAYALDVAAQARISGDSGPVGAIDGTNYALSLQNNGAATWLEILNNGGVGKGAFFGMSGNNFEQYNYQGGDIIFYTDTTASSDVERLRIAANGNVGIGTDSTPNALFNVGNNSEFQVNSSGAIAAATGIASSGTINFSGLSASSVVYTDGSKNLTTTAPTTGTVGYWSRSAQGALTPATTNDIVAATSSAYNPFTATTNNPAGTLANNTLIQHVAAGTVSNLLTLSRTAGTVTTGLNLSGTMGTDISLQNNETISNNTDGTISLGATITSLTGVLSINGTSGTAINITNSGITTDISLQNGETIDNNTDGTVSISADQLQVLRPAGSSSTPDLYISSNFAQNYRISTNLSSGNYNALVQAGDHGIIFDNGAQNTGFLTLGPWTNVSGGIGMRMAYEGSTLFRSNSNGNAALIVNQQGSYDIFSASKSGTTEFLINSAGNVGIGTTSIPTESNLVIAANTTTEGGQIQLNPGSSGSVAYFLDVFSDTFRILRGTTTASAANILVADQNTFTLSSQSTLTASSLATFTTSTSLSMNPNTGSTYTLGTTATTINLFNTTASALNFGGAATTFTLGGTTGTMSLRNPTVNVGNGGNATIATTSNGNLTLTAAGTGTILLSSDYRSGVQIGSAVQSTPLSPLYIRGGIGNNSALIINNLNNGNLIAASASGTTQFTVGTGGDVNMLGFISNTESIQFEGTLDWVIGQDSIGEASNCTQGTGGVLCFGANGTPKMSLSNAGQVVLNSNIVTNGSPDVAENIQVVDQSIEAADILAATEYDENNSDVYDRAIGSSSSSEYQSSVIGVVSSNAGLLLNARKIFGVGDDSNQRALAVAGRIPTKVSTVNGSIRTGDPITSSSINKFGMKATKAGTIVGKALEDFDPVNGKGTVIPCPAGTAPNVVCGKILTLLNVSFYDPDVYLTNTGNVHLDQVGPVVDYNFKVQKNGENITRISLFSEVVVANFRGGVASIQRLTVQSITGVTGTFQNFTTDTLAIATSNITIAGQSIQDFIANIVDQRIAQNPGSGEIVSPLETDGNNVAVKLKTNDDKSKFVVKNASGSAVAIIDGAGNASLSGQLSANGASISGTLRADRIIANNIEGLNIQASTVSANYITNNYYISTPSGEIQNATPSGFFNQSATGSAMFGDLTAQTATFTNGLMSFGPTSFFEASVADRLFVGSQLSLADNSINVLGSDLKIQPLRQGDVSFMAGLVKIDTEGNLNVGGNSYFAKDVEVKGKLAANIIAPLSGKDLVIQLDEAENNKVQFRNGTNSAFLSINNKGDINASGAGTFAKLNLDIVKDVQAVSDTEVIATGSAGLAEIKANKEEVTINNKLVNEDSLIYITPKTSISNNSIYLIRQVPGESFTVGISDTINKKVQFNWIIIN